MRRASSIVEAPEREVAEREVGRGARPAGDVAGARVGGLVGAARAADAQQRDARAGLRIADGVAVADEQAGAGIGQQVVGVRGQPESRSSGAPRPTARRG